RRPLRSPGLCRPLTAPGQHGFTRGTLVGSVRDHKRTNSNGSTPKGEHLSTQLQSDRRGEAVQSSPAPQPASSDPLSCVRGRFLLRLRESTSALLEHVPEATAGAVLPAGPVPAQHRWTVGTGRPRPLVLDPVRYRTETATRQHPFRFTPPSLFNPAGDPRQALEELDSWSSPFDLVLTPTRLLTSDVSGMRALREAVRLVESARTHRLVL